MSGPLITLDDVTLGYDGHPAVHHLTGGVAEGALMAIVGPNGSGKSTLLKGMVGLLPTLGGEIVRHITDIAYLPQRADLDREFPATVFDLVALGIWHARGPFGGLRKEDRAAIGGALETVGLAGFERRGLDTLSGGQLQRTLFARVLLQDARMILLDEPFAAIDQGTIDDLMQLVTSWHAEGRTVIAVLHDLDCVKRHFPETLLLAREPIAWGPTAEVLTAPNLLRARHMPAAWVENAPWHEEAQGHIHAHGEHLH